MGERKRGFVDVDELQTQLGQDSEFVERLAAFYNRQLPDLHKTQNEIRMACILTCGKEKATGDRAIAIRTNGGIPVWTCHEYGCQIRGNLLALMWWLKHDCPPDGGKLKGPQFREIAEDLQALAGEAIRCEDRPTPSKPVSSETPAEPDEPEINVPLAKSEKEAVRNLVNLDERFVVDVDEMNPTASKYVRERPYLTMQVMQKWRCGYCPNDAGTLLRGKFVYCYENEQGEPLAWFGRNLHYEEQHSKWERKGDSKDEPHKFQFPRGFHRGLELYGQQCFFEHASGEQLEEQGVIVVEGPNDVIALDAIGVPAVAACSNKITDEQIRKLVEMSQSIGGAVVTVMFDCDSEGENGAEQAVMKLAEQVAVRLGWSPSMYDGKFRGRQPESLKTEEWGEIAAFLRSQGGNG